MALYIVSIFTDVENRNKSCPRMWFDSSGFPIYDTVIIPPITDMNFVISNIPLILKTSVSNHKLMALSPTCLVRVAADRPWAPAVWEIGWERISSFDWAHSRRLWSIARPLFPMWVLVPVWYETLFWQHFCTTNLTGMWRVDKLHGLGILVYIISSN